MKHWFFHYYRQVGRWKWRSWLGFIVWLVSPPRERSVPVKNEFSVYGCLSSKMALKTTDEELLFRNLRKKKRASLQAKADRQNSSALTWSISFAYSFLIDILHFRFQKRKYWNSSWMKPKSSTSPMGPCIPSISWKQNNEIICVLLANDNWIIKFHQKEYKIQIQYFLL